MASAHDKITVTYLSPEELRTALLQAQQQSSASSPISGGAVVVVDVRDGDFAGGNIKGAWHFPSRELFNGDDDGDDDDDDKRDDDQSRVASRLLSIVQRAARAGASRIVYHCMQSQVRGPRAARETARVLQETLATKPASLPHPLPSIHILSFGFSGWISRFGGRDETIDNFDPNIWC